MTSRKKKTVLSLVGARPQFVKLAPLAAALKKSFHHIIVHSGQHYDARMSDSFFSQLHIPDPNINLEIGSGNHGQQTGRMLEKFEAVLLEKKPDMVLVYGDTNTTLAGALAAAKLHIPVGHIESGLRSFNKRMPEEINRIVADATADLLFYPTTAARENLLCEGQKNGLVNSGDLMYEILDACTELSGFRSKQYEQFGVGERDYCLVTLHRAENADHKDRLEKFVDILKSLPCPAVFLVHPRTRKNLIAFGLMKTLDDSPSVVVSEPLPYIETLSLLSTARALLTDSGGMQKEAYFLGCPCITLRSETEWVETVKAGANTLADLSKKKILTALKSKASRRRKLNYRIRGIKPSDVIAGAIESFLTKHE
ncbi:MAG: UDP-N-acetylglucosamine 2-epimerase (non-hydrolyzing) [Candidatus Zixiibacteriota bacterium]